MEAIGVDQGGLWVSGYIALRNIPEGLSQSEIQSGRGQERESDDAVVVADCWDVGPEDPANPWVELMTSIDIRAFLVVPVMSGGLRIGGLALASGEPRLWLKDEIALAESVGGQVGSAAERLELLGKTQEQARQVQLIIDTVPDGVLLLDEFQRIVLANPAAREYLSILLGGVDITGPLTHLAGQPIQDLFRDASDSGWRELQSARESPQIFEIAARPLEVMTFNAGWVLVLRDVTDERASLARVQMQERLATVGQLAAGIAHDFNNIMAAIVVYTDLLTVDPTLSDKSKEQIKIIQQQIQRAISLIRQILDFSRRSVMEPSPLDLLPFINELDKLLGRTLPENIFLRLSYQPGVYMVKADPTRLQQIFMNLALNARDAMPLGGDLQFLLDRFHLLEGERPPLPELTPGNWIRLSIRDTGVGIPEEILPHIFDPFYTTKPAGKGTGLGLAQVYGIVKQHGGSIDVESRLGEGATFRLYFPELAVPEELAVVPEGASLLTGSGECILLVEDDPTTREALQSLLESRNFSVLTAEDGIDALRVFEQGNPAIDLVISDVVMPGMGGVTLYYALRERGLDLKMLFITGHPLDRESQNLLEESHVEWLLKPFSVQEFLKALQRMLASSN
jgi:signal transduction histidine kinase/ActR/RegA family two-component response regulator